VAPACGLLQLSDVARLWRRRPLAWWLRDYLASIPDVYLAGHRGCPSLLDPLVVLESNATPVRPLPPVWLGVGTRDPVLDDTRRCAAALQRRGVPHAVEYYPGGLHAFQAAVPLRLARRFWRDQLSFLDTALR
jgi:acetyl esterase/lipase